MSTILLYSPILLYFPTPHICLFADFSLKSTMYSHFCDDKITKIFSWFLICESLTFNYPMLDKIIVMHTPKKS